jgi:large subunit ribosomal protein L10
MNWEQKGQRTVELQRRFKDAKLVVLTDYRGLAAGELDRLRREVREAEGLYHVAKNTLTRRAVREGSPQELTALLVGPTAVAFAYADPVAVAKVVVRFAGDHEALSIKGGLIEGEFLSPERVKELAELPSREVLYARLLAVMQAPAIRLLRALNEPAARLVRVLDVLRQRQERGEPGDG